MNRKRGRTLLYLAVALGLLTAKFPVGAWLGKVAKANKLSSDSLGDVNPVGGTAQLVCFGLRGVAVSVLWNEVIELQKKERWFEIPPAVNSITLLQPHFASPWRYQAWNMGYNIAAAWESVTDKFHWIGQGIKFIQEGNRRLKNIPDLQWYAGFMYYHKINVADEAKHLREMFRLRGEPWLTKSSRDRERPDPYDNAYDWFRAANLVVLGKADADSPPRPPKGMGIVPFMATQAKARVGYADWMRKEGRFGINNREAWSDAAEEWRKFGLGYTFPRDPKKGEREQYIHRFEYEPAEEKALSADTKFWIKHYGDIVRYWHTRNKIRAEATPELQDFRRLSYEALADNNDRQDVEGAIKKAKEAFPRLIALVQKPDFQFLKEDIELLDDAVELQTLYVKLAPRGGDGGKAPLDDVLPGVKALMEYNEEAAKMPAQQAPPEGSPTSKALPAPKDGGKQPDPAKPAAKQSKGST